MSTSGWVANPKSDAIVLQKDLGDVSFAAMLIFGGADDLSTDACQWGGTRSVPGPTVEDFVAALDAVAGFESSDPVDVTVDGYHGKRIQLKVPDDTNMSDCQNGEYHGIEGWYNFSPGQTHDVWVLDLDGTRSIFFTVYDANTPAAAQDELTQVGDSLEIQPTTP